MYLAINYSTSAASLVQTGKIQLDFFKTPDWEWLVDEAQSLKPVAVHFTLTAGNATLGTVNWDVVEHLAQTTATPYINLHLDARNEYYPDLPVNTTDPSDTERVLSVMISDVMNVVERYSPGRVIIENSPYQGEAGFTLRPCVDPDLICRVVEETGCGFLLDISHAFITAHFMGMDHVEYFSRLPVHQVREMHIAGIHNLNGKLVDHLSMMKEDWQRLDWVLSRIQSGEWSEPWMLAFEYGGVGVEFEGKSDPHVIADQTPRIFEKMQQLVR